MPRFSDVGLAMGADDSKDARGMAVADFDNDGDLDIVVNVNPGDCGKPSIPVVMLRNDIGQKRNWLAVDLSGVNCNRDALGAEVTVHLQGPTGGTLKLMRHVQCGSGYASQNSNRLYFGLGEADRVSGMTVRWPGGKQQQFGEVPANRLVRWTEGQDPVVTNLGEPGGKFVASR